jgi:hypothetical protein
MELNMATEPKNLKALEEATPLPIEKLARLTATLSPEEKIVFSGVKIARLISRGIFFFSPYTSGIYTRNQVGSKFDARSHTG